MLCWHQESSSTAAAVPFHFIGRTLVFVSVDCWIQMIRGRNLSSISKALHATWPLVHMYHYSLILAEMAYHPIATP